MANTTDATKQAALATVIFGKGGVEMSRILDQGRASLDKFKQTAKGLGIIIPDDLLQKAGELDDKLDVLSKVIDVQLGEALINAGPGLVAFTSDIAGLSREINGISKAMQGGSGGALPTVTRYGSNPNKITLPQQDYTDQSNVNGSGVNVRKYNPVPQASGDYAPNGKPIIYLKPGQAEDSFPDGINAEFRRTTDNTELTADNVSKLDANTKRYLDGLSRDIGGYSQQQMAQQTVAISKLSEVASCTTQ